MALGKISVLKIAAQAFEAGGFPKKFFRFLDSWGSFSNKKFFLQKNE